MDKYQMSLLSEARGKLSASRNIMTNIHGQHYVALLKEELHGLVDLLDAVIKREIDIDTGKVRGVEK